MTETIAFDKIHACGNDFVLVEVPPTLELLHAVCDRHHGLGADGMMIWRRDGDRVILDHYDPDGSRTLCLNGTRASLGCLAAQDKIPQKGLTISENFEIPYEIEDNNVFLHLPTQPYSAYDWIKRDWHILGFKCNVGNPHYVLLDSLVPDLFTEIAPTLRNDLDAFPEGTNVHLVWDEDDVWRIRSYERGVEGFTLACGSGMYAGAIIAMSEEGGDEVLFKPDGQGEVLFRQVADNIVMSGETRWVASGVYRC